MTTYGHKTFRNPDGSFRHEPLSNDEAETLLAECDRREKLRAEQMPTEQDALRVLMDAYTRLGELGWKNAIYCPKDGTLFHAIEAGSTGIHECYYQGQWPNGSWWIPEDGDEYPSRPILFKPMATRRATAPEGNG